MKKTIILTGLLSAILVTGSAQAKTKTVGIWKDVRIGNLSGVQNILTNSGWTIKWLSDHTEKINGKKKRVVDIEMPERLEECDAVIFTGGWGRYFFPSYRARKALIRYAAGGGGVALVGFRGGYPRTANRPMFPEIATVENRLSSAWLFPVGESSIAKAFGGKALLGGSGDHLTLKMGPMGKVFAENSGDAVGAYGDFGCGRVVVYGGQFSYSPKDDMSQENDRILLAILDYLTSPARQSDAKRKAQSDIAESRFIRRERMWDLTLDERGSDRKAGIIPMARDGITAVPEALAFKLEYFAGFLSGSDARKCTAEAARLHSEVDKVRAEAVRMKDDANATLEDMDVAKLNEFKISDSKWSDGSVKARFAEILNTNSIPAVKALVAELAPKVKAAKAAALDRELKEDLKTVPALIEKTSSASAVERVKAAMEIGRIQPSDKASLDALVRLLDDPVSKVRTQAAISLGWMQAKGAVDALVAKTTSKCIWDRRRAVQALGNIGDVRAAKALLKAVDDDDIHVRQLAVLSLGYLKARDAIPKLLEIARSSGEDKYAESADCAVYALGFIGDRSVVKEIEKIRDTVKYDGPFYSRNKKPTRNLMSFGTHGVHRPLLGRKLAAEEALKLLEQGGRKEPGVKQMKERRAKDVFYAITGNCSAFAGRIANGTQSTFGHANRKYILPYLKEAGFTGVHNAWGQPGWSTEYYLDMLREADENGLLWIDTLPGYADSTKSLTTYRMEKTADIPSLAGFWAEETWPVPGMSRKGFIERAKKRYGEDWHKGARLNEAEITEIESRLKKGGYIAFSGFCQEEKKKEANYEAPWNGALRTVMLELEGEVIRDCWRESQDYLHGCRMGFAHTFVISTADPARFPNDNKALETLDSIGLESYQSFGRSSAYFMQRYRDGEGRSSMSELYNWYCPSPQHALRGFWQNAIHSKCFYNFALYHIFKYASSEYLWVWDVGRWDRFREVYRRVAANREYYKIVPSAANVAVLFSSRTPSLARDNSYSPCPVPQRSDQNAMAVWTAVNQNHMPADVVYADDVSLEKLLKYDVLYLTNSKYLDQKAVESIRAYVKSGGVLVAEGGSTIFDAHTLQLRSDYALADVFGVDYVTTKYLPDEESDTFSRRRGMNLVSAFKFVGDLKRPYHFEDSVHRDIKPQKSIRQFSFTEGCSAFMPGFKAGDSVEIDAALGIDVVKEDGARCIAKYPDGTGAVFVNEFGKGRCYFISSQYPIMGHVASEWQMMPNKFVFWKNVSEMLDSCIRGGFAKKGVTARVEIEGAGPEIEVTIDDHGDKYVVHFLDYDVKSKGAKGIEMSVPGTRAIKRIWYPDTKTELKVVDRKVKLRDFLPYDMLVIEFQ